MATIATRRAGWRQEVKRDAVQQPGPQSPRSKRHDTPQRSSQHGARRARSANEIPIKDGPAGTSTEDSEEIADTPSHVSATAQPRARCLLSISARTLKPANFGQALIPAIRPRPDRGAQHRLRRNHRYQPRARSCRPRATHGDHLQHPSVPYRAAATDSRRATAPTSPAGRLVPGWRVRSRFAMHRS
jgi:hypothetical protein